jgi:exodeoxyribonuclease V alpha subunit
MRAVLRRVAGGEPSGDPPAGRSFGDGVVVLSSGHRYGAAISALAQAVRDGDAEGALAALAAGGDEIAWLPGDADQDAGLDPLRERAVASYGAVVAAARAGDGTAALAALGGFRLLCAHRRGEYGVASWAARVERWLADAIEAFQPGERGYVGRPLLITENDRELKLFNGDTGVVIETPDGEPSAVFEQEGALVGFAPSRLASVETLYATTVHKAQGSQFQVAGVVLPDPSSRVLSRELLYTAVTRARRQLIVVGDEAAIRAAIARPVARASGLRELLWD